MPALEVADSSSTLGNVLAQTSAEAASLHGHKAKTPMLAGTIIGTIMGVAYIIGFTIYFVKRCKRKRLKRRIEAGQAEPKPRPEPEKQEKIVIPPDPAVLPGSIIAPEM
ncbi:hypothetical protein C8R46DRAFT_8515 [Mycena filopes]|nr:hypothetical protein C8R46DRAFT_8515 [Mycena filopes]